MMVTSNGLHKMGRIIIACVVTISLSLLYWLDPDVDPDAIDKILVIPLLYFALKGPGKSPE